MEPNLKFVKSCKQAGYKFEELFKKRLCLKTPLKRKDWIHE